MNSFKINTEQNKEVFKPGQIVKGSIGWQLDVNPQDLELTLYWHTKGKGTEDVGIVEALKFDNPGSFGSDDFQFTLPKGPYSFSGKLISIIWTLELTAPKVKETGSKIIIVSPFEKEIVCTETCSDQDNSLKFGFLKNLKVKFTSRSINN